MNRRLPPPAVTIYSNSTASGLSIQLLGRFAVRRDGEEVEVTASARRVISYVALQGAPIPRTQVASRLWMDVSDDRAGANLRSSLWRLRRQNLPILSVTASTIAIRDSVDVDYENAREAVDIINGSEPPEEVFVLLYQDLLPDDYEDWVLGHRERYRNLRLHALERRCANLRAQGHYAEAVDIGLTVVSMDPLRETAQEGVIRTYIAENNRAEAVRQYRSYAEMLRHELGLEPSSSLTRLVQGEASRDATR